MQMVPPPPMTPLPPDVAYFVGFLGLLVGLVLLLAGRLVDRAVLALAGGCVGGALAGPLARSWGVNWMFLAIPAAVLLAVAFALSGRVLWALAAAALFACLAALVAAVAYWPWLASPMATTTQSTQPYTQPAPGSWCQSAGELVHQTLGALWKQQPGVMIWTLCLGGGLPLAAAVLLPRLARIVMTAVLGAVATVAGAMLMLAPVHPRAWPDRWALVGLWVMLAVVLMMAGIVHQYYRALSKPPPAKPAAQPPKPPPKGSSK